MERDLDPRYKLGKLVSYQARLSTREGSIAVKHEKLAAMAVETSSSPFVRRGRFSPQFLYRMAKRVERDSEDVTDGQAVEQLGWLAPKEEIGNCRDG